MPTFILRAGLPVAVPADYARDPAHRLLVEQLTKATRYRDAVGLLQRHAVSWLAADVLAGAPWAQRYLNTTARFSQSADPADRRLAAAGLRALMHVLAGTPGRVGRRRAPPLSAGALTEAAAAIARWTAVIAPLRPENRPDWPQAVLEATPDGFRLSHAHRRALRALVRRPGLRKHDLVLTLASWETGIPVRRLRPARSMAALVYG